MSLSLSQIVAKVRNFRLPIADSKGRMTREFQELFFESITESESVVATAQEAADTAQSAASTAQTAATTAQTSADDAQDAAASASGTSTYAVDQNHQWYSDAGGTLPAGNPTKDLTLSFEDKDGTVIATRVLRGTLTSASGLISVTNVSNTGLDTSFTLSNDGTSSVVARVTVTLTDGSMYTARMTWSALDISVGGELTF
ncbi:MAG: hypothetical protein ACPGSC_09275 [Granulosicoccaceae bacterium]